tara:strand:+ start:1182 stop:1352 length:171 start_codon:yes stop_codon:yes gene_type:complete
MRDRVGENQDGLDSIFGRLLIIEEQIKIITQRLNWVENPTTAPKSKQAPKEPEGKL